MRTPKPWYKKSKQTWYVYRHGKLVALAKGDKKKTKKQAEDAFHALMSSGETPQLGKAMKVAKVFDLFLERCQHETESYDWYKMFLQEAATLFGGVPYTQLKVHHLTKWLNRKRTRVWRKRKSGKEVRRETYVWSDTTKNKAIGAVKAALNFCIAEGHIEGPNPIGHMKKPPCAARERILTAEERELIFASIKDQSFLDFLWALQESGCRPSEAARLTAENVSLAPGRWVRPKHKTAKKTKRARVIYCSPALLSLTKRLLENNDGGSLFRNRRGKPWTRNALRCRFRQLRKKFPQLAGVISYTYRHSFGTDALEKGIPDATVAELMGHAGTATLHRYYSKLSKKVDHLRDAAKLASQCASDLPGSAPTTGTPEGTDPGPLPQS